MRTLFLDQGYPSALRVSPDGTRLAVRHGDPPGIPDWAPDATLMILDLDAGLPQAIRETFTQYPYDVPVMEWSGDGSYLVLGIGAGEFEIWRSEDLTTVATITHEGHPRAAAFSVDGTRLVTATSVAAEHDFPHGDIRIWPIDLPP